MPKAKQHPPEKGTWRELKDSATGKSVFEGRFHDYAEASAAVRFLTHRIHLQGDEYEQDENLLNLSGPAIVKFKNLVLKDKYYDVAEQLNIPLRRPETGSGSKPKADPIPPDPTPAEREAGRPTPEALAWLKDRKESAGRTARAPRANDVKPQGRPTQQLKLPDVDMTPRK